MRGRRADQRPIKTAGSKIHPIERTREADPTAKPKSAASRYEPRSMVRRRSMKPQSVIVMNKGSDITIPERDTVPGLKMNKRKAIQHAQGATQETSSRQSRKPLNKLNATMTPFNQSQWGWMHH